MKRNVRNQVECLSLVGGVGVEGNGGRVEVEGRGGKVLCLIFGFSKLFLYSPC